MCKQHHKSVPNCLRFETNAEGRGLKTPRPSFVQSEVSLRHVPCWQAFSRVFWSPLALYLFIDVISNLGKLSKLECDIKLALLLKWLVRRVFNCCSLCAVPYIFSFRFREVNLQIAESIWCGSPRKWSWNGGVVSVEKYFYLSRPTPVFSFARVVSETRGPGHNQYRLWANFLHPAVCACIYVVTTRTPRFKRKKRVLGGEYLQNISVIAFKKVVWLSELDNLPLKQKYLVFKFLTRTV